MLNEQSIAVKNVSKTFGEGYRSVYALKNVNFEAFTHELLMIVGPSGSGKTTLLSVVAGTLSFDEGEIFVFNTPLHLLSKSEITTFRRQNVGFVFQQFHLIPTLNCMENIAIPLLLNGWKFKEATEKGAEMMAKVGLKGREYENPSYLSGGEQQRIAIARGLIHEPKLLICDEPTSALDEATGHTVMDLLSQIAKNDHRTVIVVTHDNRIYHYADRVTTMNDGKIVSSKVGAK